jgi:broad specificity phosphatase PhoE
MHTTRFCLIRHGETDWNRERRLQGHLDIPLNPRGLQQAEQLAQALAQQQLAFSALHVSELTRARQTATAISRQLGLPLQTHPALKERHYGAFQGHTFDEAREHIPHAYRLHQERTCISTCKAAKACTTSAAHHALHAATGRTVCGKADSGGQPWRRTGDGTSHRQRPGPDRCA